MHTNKINIQSNRGIYSVNFTSQVNTTLELLMKKYTIHFLIDKNVYARNKEIFENPLKSAHSVYTFVPSEKKKNLLEIYKFVEFLLEKKVQKNHKIIVIGGGLVQDIGSFSSHILFRGIDWIFIPTTLLAMADSCIGSKSGINVGKYKNQVGSFHHPTKIYIYPSFLKTLPKSGLLNGIGEIIKHLLIQGEPVFSTGIKGIDSIGKNLHTTKELIYQSLLIKKDIIEKDEYEEKKLRKLLNYGHTFGHALEGYSKNKISHGIGVLYGMDLANYISFKRNLLSEKEFQNFHSIIKKYVPFKKIPIRNIDLYLDFLSKDKKAVGLCINAILCKGLGKIVIVKLDLDQRLVEEITEYCKLYNKEG